LKSSATSYGYSHVIHATPAEELGIDAFLMKPVDIDALAETIEQVLSRVRAERANVSRIGIPLKTSLPRARGTRLIGMVCCGGARFRVY
jgi:DNA-binding NtrC family response regulator